MQAWVHSTEHGWIQDLVRDGSEYLKKGSGMHAASKAIRNCTFITLKSDIMQDCEYML